MLRKDGRTAEELRPVRITTGYTENADGSVLIECGRTRVICTAMIEEGVPPFLKGSGKGWLTAEYSMLPSATPQRKKRENAKNGQDGRSVEIGRLIGRSLRCGVDLSKLGERCIHIDCDVIQADGGTRTASITGGYVALAIALDKLRGEDGESLLLGPVAAVSAGVVDGKPLLDLCYEEDSSAEADVNIVMQMEGFVEVQGTGEKRAISRKELNALLDLGEKGIKQLNQLQREARVNARKEALKK